MNQRQEKGLEPCVRYPIRKKAKVEVICLPTSIPKVDYLIGNHCVSSSTVLKS